MREVDADVVVVENLVVVVVNGGADDGSGDGCVIIVPSDVRTAHLALPAAAQRRGSGASWRAERRALIGRPGNLRQTAHWLPLIDRWRFQFKTLRDWRLHPKAAAEWWLELETLPDHQLVFLTFVDWGFRIDGRRG